MLKYLIKLNAIALDLTTTTAKQAFAMMKIEIALLLFHLPKITKRTTRARLSSIDAIATIRSKKYISFQKEWMV